MVYRGKQINCKSAFSLKREIVKGQHLEVWKFKKNTSRKHWSKHRNCKKIDLKRMILRIKTQRLIAMTYTSF